MWLRFDPWPQNFCMLQAEPKKKKKKKKKEKKKESLGNDGFLFLVQERERGKHFYKWKLCFTFGQIA